MFPLSNRIWPTHANSVFDIRCKNEALKNCTLKSSINASKSKNRQVIRFTVLISPHRLLCRNKTIVGRSLWYSVIDILIVTASIKKNVFLPWMFIDQSEHHYTTQTSKFTIFFKRASTMLNNVFNINEVLKKKLTLCTICTRYSFFEIDRNPLGLVGHIIYCKVYVQNCALVQFPFLLQRSDM